MMFLRLVAFAVIVLGVTSCPLLNSSEVQEIKKQAAIQRQLYDLQIALESSLGNKPVSTSTPAASPNGHDAENGPAVDTSMEDHPNNQTGSGTTASIVAVVDSLLLVPGSEGEEIDPAAQDAALRRERLVRTAINTSLVKNNLIDMIQPTTDERERIRLGLIATNCSMMSPTDAKTAGDAIGVDHLIWARIENEGDAVNIVAQRVDNGVVVFDQTLSGWSIFKTPKKEEEE